MTYPDDGFADFYKATQQPGPCFKCGKIIAHQDALPMHMPGMTVFVCAGCYDPEESEANLKADLEDWADDTPGDWISLEESAASWEAPADYSTVSFSFESFMEEDTVEHALYMSDHQ